MIGPLGPEPDARSIHATGVLVWVASSALEGILPPHCVHAIFPHAPAIINLMKGRGRWSAIPVLGQFLKRSSKSSTRRSGGPVI